MTVGGPVGSPTLRRALLSFALFRIESALVVALTVVLAGSAALGASWAPGPWWAWLLFGIVGEVAIFLTTLTDRGLRGRLRERLLRNRYDPTRLREPSLQRKVSEALDYRELIAREIDRRRAAPGPGLDELLSELEEWLGRTYRLASHLDAYRRHPVLARERERVPIELSGLRDRLGGEGDAAVREQLEAAFAAKEQQWEAIKALESTMTRAEIELDSTLSNMGAVHTRVVNLGARGMDAARARDLAREMHAQVEALADLDAAMDEVARITAR